MQPATALCTATPQEEIYSSSYAAAAYLESINFKKKVYVIGEEGILQVRRVPACLQAPAIYECSLISQWACSLSSIAGAVSICHFFMLC